MKNIRNLGKHQAALLAFCRANPGPHSLTSNLSDPAHRALASLSRRGLLVRSTLGNCVFAELPALSAQERAELWKHSAQSLNT